MNRYSKYKESDVEWIGPIPQNWEVRKIKSAHSDLIGGVWGNEPEGNENDFYCIRVADFNYAQLAISTIKLTLRNIQLRESDKRILRTDELLIEKSGGGEKTPVGRTVIFHSEMPRRSVTSNFVSKFKAKLDSCFPRYLLYCLSFLYGIGITRRHIKQSTGLQNLDIDSYFQERIPFPSLIEQTQIAAFLDRKTGQIDELIRVKVRKVELLREQRTALINQAVTKGLAPNVEMKPSGVEWIGEIPKDWEVTRLKYICELIVDCEHKTAPSQETGYPLIRTSDIGIGHLILDSVNRVSEETYHKWSKRTIPQSGDLILAREAPVGNVAIIPKDFKVCLGQRTVLIRPDKNKVCSVFLVYLMLGDETQARLLEHATGSTVHHLNMSDIRSLELPRLPSLRTQRKIASFLDRKTQQVDKLVSEEQRSIELLKEYRQSLISDAVTGKIDVICEV